MEHSSVPSRGCRRAQSPQSPGRMSGPGSASRVLDLAMGSAFVQLNSPKSQLSIPAQPLHPSGADVGPDRKHLQALSPQPCCPSCLALPTRLLPPPGSHAILPALPTISMSMGTFLKSQQCLHCGHQAPSPLCLVSQAQLVPVSGYR